MISYTTYKIVHYLGVFTAVAALGAYLSLAASGGNPLVRRPWSRRLMAAHGVGLFLVLLGGFGMLARLDATEGMQLPGWIWAKLGIWALLGGMVSVAKRRPETSGWLLLALPALAVLAGTIALTKPF